MHSAQKKGNTIVIIMVLIFSAAYLMMTCQMLCTIWCPSTVSQCEMGEEKMRVEKGAINCELLAQHPPTRADKFHKNFRINNINNQLDATIRVY